MLTKLLNNQMRSSNQTHRKPFFPRTIDLADIYELSYSPLPNTDNAPHTGDASRSLQSSPSVGGSTRIGLQNLPTGRLRRPDTETGLRGPMTNLSELATNPSNSPVSDIRYQPEQATKKPKRPSRRLTVLVGVLIYSIALMFCSTGVAVVLGETSGGGEFESRLIVIIFMIVFFCMAVLISRWALQRLPIY